MEEALRKRFTKRFLMQEGNERRYMDGDDEGRPGSRRAVRIAKPVLGTPYSFGSWGAFFARI